MTHDPEVILAKCEKSARHYATQLAGEARGPTVNRLLFDVALASVHASEIRHLCTVLELLVTPMAQPGLAYAPGHCDEIGDFYAGFDIDPGEPAGAGLPAIAETITVVEVWKGGANIAQGLSEDTIDTITDTLIRDRKAAADHDKLDAAISRAEGGAL